VQTPSGVRTEKRYDDAMRLKSIKAFDAENALVDSYTYEYDPASQRTSETQLSDTTPGWVRKFEYDQQRQLTAAYRLASGSTAHDPNYDYGHAFDPIGNRLSTAANGISTAYVPNALNQYTSITTQGQAEAQPAYDDNGNLTNDGSQSYTFDDENRLVNVQRAGVNSVSVYDALCRRIAAKKANGASVTAETRFIYDGWNPVAELNANNLVTRRYTWGLDLSNTPQGAGGVGGLLAMTTNTGAANAATYVYNYDGNGNITSLVKEADQTVAARYEYGPFGEPLHATGVIAAQNPFRFSTQYTDDETGLLYYGYRYYNPSTGRWINRDPAEEKGGLNLYGMVYNNPISYIDLVGLISKAITFYYTQDDTAGPGAANAITAQIQFFNEMLKKCKCSNDYPDIVVRGMPSKNTPRDYPLDLSGKTLQFNGGSDSVRDREVKAFYDVLNADMPFN